LKYSIIKTDLAGTMFAYIKARYPDSCWFTSGQPFIQLWVILKAVKKSQDNIVKPGLPITPFVLSQLCQ